MLELHCQTISHAAALYMCSKPHHFFMHKIEQEYHLNEPALTMVILNGQSEPTYTK